MTMKVWEPIDELVSFAFDKSNNIMIEGSENQDDYRGVLIGHSLDDPYGHSLAEVITGEGREADEEFAKLIIAAMKYQVSEPTIEEVVQHSDLLPGELDDLSVPMSNADCVKVWSQLHEARTKPPLLSMACSSKDPGAEIEDSLYRVLSKRLAIEAQMVVFVTAEEPPYVDGALEFVRRYFSGRVVEVGAEGEVDRMKLYEDFRGYCDLEDYPLLGRKKFFSCIKQIVPGLEIRNCMGRRYFKGLKIAVKEVASG